MARVTRPLKHTICRSRPYPKPPSNCSRHLIHGSCRLRLRRWSGLLIRLAAKSTRDSSNQCTEITTWFSSRLQCKGKIWDRPKGRRMHNKNCQTYNLEGLQIARDHSVTQYGSRRLTWAPSNFSKIHSCSSTVTVRITSQYARSHLISHPSRTCQPKPRPNTDYKLNINFDIISLFHRSSTTIN